MTVDQVGETYTAARDHARGFVEDNKVPSRHNEIVKINHSNFSNLHYSTIKYSSCLLQECRRLLDVRTEPTF